MKQFQLIFLFEAIFCFLLLPKTIALPISNLGNSISNFDSKKVKVKFNSRQNKEIKDSESKKIVKNSAINSELNGTSESSQINKSVIKGITDANKSLAEGNPELALKILEHLEKDMPGSIVLQVDRALCLFDLNRIDESLKILKKIAQKNDSYYKIYEILGKIDFSQGNYLQAKNEYRKSLKCLEEKNHPNPNPNPNPNYIEHKNLVKNYELYRITKNSIYSENLYQLARLSFILDERDEAIALARKSLSYEVRFDVQILLVDLLVYSGFYEEAVSALENMENKEPANLNLKYRLASLYSKQGNSVKAFEKLKYIRAMQPENISILQQIICLYAACNDWPNAYDYAKEWLSLDKNNAAAYFVFAWTALKNQEFSESESALKEALKLNSKEINVLNTYGIVLLELKKPEEAMLQFQKVAKLQKSDLFAQLNILSLYLTQSRFAEMTDLFNSLDLTIKNDPHIRALYNYSRAKNGDFSWTKNYHDMESNMIKDPLALLAFAIFYVQENDLKKAENFYLETLKISPDSQFVLTEYSDFLFKCGKYKEAREKAQEALQIAPTNIMAKYCLANALFAEGNAEGATLFLKECVARVPKNIFWRLKLAETQSYMGDYLAAEGTLEKAIKSFPNSEIAYLHLADLFYKEKNYSKAELFIDKSLDLNPHLDEANILLARIYFARQKYYSCFEILDKLNNISKVGDIELLASTLSKLKMDKEAVNKFRYLRLKDVDLCITSRLDYVESLLRISAKKEASKELDSISSSFLGNSSRSVFKQMTITEQLRYKRLLSKVEL